MDKNNGALLLDAISRLIIGPSIVPRFRAGDMAADVGYDADDILAVLAGEAEAWHRRVAAASAPHALAPIRGGSPGRW